jgi:hypothetical protein
MWRVIQVRRGWLIECQRMVVRINNGKPIIVPIARRANGAISMSLN